MFHRRKRAYEYVCRVYAKGVKKELIHKNKMTTYLRPAKPGIKNHTQFNTSKKTINRLSATDKGHCVVS